MALPKLVSVSTQEFFGEHVLQTEIRDKGLNRAATVLRGSLCGSAAVPVHDVGRESGGEAEHVEADLRGCAQGQADHDWEEGQVYPQPCRLQNKQYAQWK